ncbi:MAG TPA: ubiquitin-like small modifier protein 1 [Anaerolineales bacterium]
MAVVKLYANLRKLAGAKELPAKGDTVRSVLDDLVGQHTQLGEALLVNGEVRPHVILTLNGQHLVHLDTPVEEQDVIAIFPPIAGGR